MGLRTIGEYNAAVLTTEPAATLESRPPAGAGSSAERGERDEGPKRDCKIAGRSAPPRDRGLAGDAASRRRAPNDEPNPGYRSACRQPRPRAADHARAHPTAARRP